MNIKGRCGIAVLILCALMVMIYVGWLNADEVEQAQMGQFVPQKETIVLWYTDDALTDYLNSVALVYYENTDVHVETKLVSGLEYLEGINDASIKDKAMPDLYIVGNDSLGKAYLSGLATEVEDTYGILNTDNYCQAALDAVTYDHKLVAYPMYFETSCLLYNETYLEEIALAQVLQEQAAAAQEAGEAGAEVTDETAAEGDAEAGSTEETEDPELQAAVLARTQELVPGTVDDILTFADSYDAPETVDSIFTWDVSDIFYNYFFVGNYVNVGGASGDDVSDIDIYNENAIRCLDVYQKLSQFFSIDADSVTYDSVVQDFIAGKTIFTVATTDVIATLEQAQAEGTFAYEYGVATIPDLTDQLESKEVSVTDAIAINSYSIHKEAANELAKYICNDYADSLYTRTGKVSANQKVSYENAAVPVMLTEYALSIPMPKIVETSNFWVELELCFTNVWTGEDTNQALKSLSENIMKQVTGAEYTEEYIEIPEEEETEYSDEGMGDTGTDSGEYTEETD